jgi:hypothetical protein
MYHIIKQFCLKTHDSRGDRAIEHATNRVGTKYGELIEIKRVYKHPRYKYGRAYDDIALLELGRRIVYDYDTYGFSPTCLDLTPSGIVYCVYNVYCAI